MSDSNLAEINAILEGLGSAFRAEYLRGADITSLVCVEGPDDFAEVYDSDLLVEALRGCATREAADWAITKSGLAE